MTATKENRGARNIDKYTTTHIAQKPGVLAKLKVDIDTTDSAGGNNFDPEKVLVNNGTADKHFRVIPPNSTMMILALQHSDTASVSGTTAPIFNVFGKWTHVDSDGTETVIWNRLYNIEDTPSADITLTPVDLNVEVSADASTFITPFSGKAVTIDLLGCEEVAVGIKTPAVWAGMNTNTAIVWGLFI